MRSRDDEALLWGLAIVGVVFLAIVFNFARFIGADFGVTLNAVLVSGVSFGVPVWLIAQFGASVPAVLFAWGAFAWPVAWWDVLDNIADKVASIGPGFRLEAAVPWYAGSAFKWSVEVVLVALTIYFATRRSSRYGY